jgi:hypothetical protein
MGAKKIFCISREIRRSTEGDEKIEPKKTKEKAKETQSEPRRENKREPKKPKENQR